MESDIKKKDDNWKDMFPQDNRYFETDNGILYCGDCLDIMKSIPKGVVDLVLTDPPYNISKKDKIIREGGKFSKAKPINLDFGEWDYGSLKWEDYISMFNTFLTDVGVLVMFYNKLKIGAIANHLTTIGWKVRHIGIWIKTNPAPQARKVKWQDGSEFFIVATKNHRSGHHFNYKLGQSKDYFTHSVSFKHLHPTQKPLDLIKWIASYWSYEEDLVVDPFLGSGTTAIACEKLNRRWIGIELSPEYCETIVKRLKFATRMRPLFAFG